MAVINLVTADRVRIVEPLVQMTLPAAADITAGMPVYIDSNGKFAPADASVAGTALVYGIAAHTVQAGFAVTAIHEGVMDGWNIDALAFGDAIYLSDTEGALDTATGTVTTLIGRVTPAHAAPLADGPDKHIYFDCF